MPSDSEGREPDEDGTPSAWRSRWNHARVWVPALAVTAVAVMAVLAAVMVTQAGPEQADPAHPTAAVTRAPAAGFRVMVAGGSVRPVSGRAAPG